MMVVVVVMMIMMMMVVKMMMMMVMMMMVVMMMVMVMVMMMMIMIMMMMLLLMMMMLLMMLITPCTFWPAGPLLGVSPLNLAPPAPHEYADKCVTSVPERLKLYGEARPKPPTLQRRAPKNTKNPSGGWGRAFWPESGSLISVSKSKRPPPF